MRGLPSVPHILVHGGLLCALHAQGGGCAWGPRRDGPDLPPAGVSDRQVHVLGTAWESCLHRDVDRDSCPPVSASGLAWRPRAHRADRSAALGVRGVEDEPGTGRTDGRREAPFTGSKAPTGLERGQEQTRKPSSGKGDPAPSTSLVLKSGRYARGPSGAAAAHRGWKGCRQTYGWTSLPGRPGGHAASD